MKMSMGIIHTSEISGQFHASIFLCVHACACVREREGKWGKLVLGIYDIYEPFKKS